MIKGEWKSLLHNKILLIVIVAIVAIPTIYTTLFLGSMWDPYGNIDKLPVAVVNEDKAVTYHDKTMNVGKDLIDNLKDNDSLQFNFVDSESARRGLENGTYYMVITIPENFSRNATTLTDATPEKMELKYETNPGTNYIASKMSDSALTKIKDSVAAEVTKEYAQTIFDEIQDAGDGMEDAADGAGEIKSGVTQVADGNTTITDNLSTLASSSLVFKEGSDTLQVGLKSYTDGVSQVNDGASKLGDGIDTLDASATEGGTQLEQGAGKLADGTASLSSGAGDLKKGAVQVDDGVKDLAQGADTLSDGGKAASDGAAKVDQGAQDLEKGINDLNLGAKDLQKGISAAMKGATGVKDGMDLLHQNSDSVKGGTQQFAAGLDTLNSSVQGITVDDSKLSQLVSGSSAFLSALQNNSVSAPEQQVNANLDMIAKLQSAAESEDDPETAGYLNGAIQMLSANNSTMEQMAAGVNDAVCKLAGEYQKIDGGIQETASTVGNIGGQVEELKTNVGNLNALFQTKLSPGITGYVDGFEQAAAVYELVYGGMEKAAAGSGSLVEGTKKAYAGSQDLTKGTDSLKDGTKELAQGSSALSEGAKTLKTGTGALRKGSSDLAEGAGSADSGAKELYQGVSQLSTGLASGITQLKDGSNDLFKGTSELVSNNDTLLKGSAQLSDGAFQISDGAEQLYEGSSTLGEGITKLSDGSLTLKDSLADGAQQMKDVTTTDNTVDMFATPVEESKAELTTVPNNGHAMAPYMMSVALWVGCIAFCIMYPLTQYHGKLKSGLSWWLSKATVIFSIAIAQALVMIFLLGRINGFMPAETGKTVLVACLASMAFMAIMYFFNICLGKIGSFLMLIFMVVQLAGSAGTYPVEISGSFVAKIHKYLPFTYTVDAFRSTIAGGQSITRDIWVLVVLLLVFTAMTVFIFRRRASRINKGKLTSMELLEKGGLA